MISVLISLLYRASFQCDRITSPPPLGTELELKPNSQPLVWIYTDRIVCTNPGCNVYPDRSETVEEEHTSNGGFMNFGNHSVVTKSESNPLITGREQLMFHLLLSRGICLGEKLPRCTMGHIHSVVITTTKQVIFSTTSVNQEIMNFV